MHMAVAMLFAIARCMGVGMGVFLAAFTQWNDVNVAVPHPPQRDEQLGKSSNGGCRTL